MAEIPPQTTGREASFGGGLDGAFSISEFCLAYKLSRSAVYKQISARRLRTMKVGSRTLISRRAARDWETLCEIGDGQRPGNGNEITIPGALVADRAARHFRARDRYALTHSPKDQLLEDIRSTAYASQSA